MVVAVGSRSSTIKNEEQWEGTNIDAVPNLIVGSSTTNDLVNAALDAERLYRDDRGVED